MIDKTVLIITDHFPPESAPRMGYLSKYLGDYNWKGIAISPFYDNERNTFDYLSGYIPCKRVSASEKNIKKNIFQKGIGFFSPDLRIPWWINKKMIQLANDLVSKEQVDIVLCSTWTLFPLNIAYKISKLFNIPWIADLRDIYEEYPVKTSILMGLFNKIGKLRRNYLLKKSNYVTVVSKKHQEILSNYKIKARIIYNGFDSELFIPSKNRRLDKFRIVYTGTLSNFSVGYDISPLFSSINKLFNNGYIGYENFRIQFYSDSKSREIINDLAIKYKINDFIDIFNNISFIEIPKILNDASILLLLVPGRNMGIMTTKFYEYLGVGRPILCIWNDEGEIEDIINKSNTGIAAKIEEEIQSFIKNKYDEWLNTGYVNSDNNNDFIMQFSRKNQAKQFTDLFNIIINTNIEDK
jgi:glycosyltransferase involved in cell wall biosynthesis